MNIKKIFTGVIALTLAQIVDLRAGDGVFPSQQLGYEFFGTYATRDREDFDDKHLGVGAGLNYFFSPHFGVEADTYLEEIDLPSHLDLSAVGRYPLSRIPLAPYAYAGFGRQWSDVSQWTAHLGIGAEYKWSGRTGIFFDGRRVYPDKAKDFTVFRLGARFQF